MPRSWVLCGLVAVFVSSGAANATPPPRWGHAMVYDRTREVVVLFGGFGEELLADTWEWDGAAWLRGPVAPKKLSARKGHGLVFDEARNLTVLFGGYGKDGSLGDTWEYDGRGWEEGPEMIQGPRRRSEAVMVYDARRFCTVMVGGFGEHGAILDTWELTAGGWQPGVSARRVFPEGARGAYDLARGVTVVFGGRSVGSGANESSWEYDGTSWRRGVRLKVSDPVAGITGHAMAYDEGRGVMVTFGGRYSSNIPFGTWELDATSVRAGPSLLASPMPHRHDSAIAYDAARRQVLLFGGRTASGPSNDTWAYDGGTWRRAEAPADGAALEDTFATVSGTVADTTGEVLAQTRVSLDRPDRRQAATAVADAGGRFRFPSVPPGEYVLRILRNGFRDIELPLELKPNEAFSRDFQLRALDRRLRVVCPDGPEAPEVSEAGVRAAVERILVETPFPADAQRAVSNAVSDLQQLGRAAYPALTELVPDLSIPALWAAARVLGDGCHRPAGPPLAARLSRFKRGLRTAADWKKPACALTVMRALATTGDDTAIPPLLRLMKNPNVAIELRREAMAALASIGTPKALTAIDGTVADAHRRPWVWQPCPGLHELQGRCAPEMERCGENPMISGGRWEELSQRLVDSTGRRFVVFRSAVLGGESDLWLLEVDRSGEPRASWFVGQVPFGRNGSFRSFQAWWHAGELFIQGPEELLRMTLEDLTKDTDGDGLSDRLEARIGTGGETADTDGDGIGDEMDSNPITPSEDEGDERTKVLKAALEFHFGLGGDEGAYRRPYVVLSDVPVECPWCPDLTLWRTREADLKASRRYEQGFVYRVQLLPDEGRGIEIRPNEAVYQLQVGSHRTVVVVRRQRGRWDVVAQVVYNIR